MSIDGPSSKTLGKIEPWYPDGQTGAHPVLEFHFNPDKVNITATSSGGSQSPFQASSSTAPSPTTSPSGSGPTAAKNPSSGGGAQTKGSSTASPGTTATTRKFTFSKIYFDGGFTTSVQPHVDQLYAFMSPPSSSATGGSTATTQPARRQPAVKVTLGDRFSVIGYIYQLTVDYLLFNAEGQPTRACVNQLVLNEYTPTSGSQNPTSGGIASYSGHIVGAGDSLQSIAFQTYGHARLWRQLAVINGIDDPLRVRPGAMLMLPTLTELLAVE